MSHLGDRLSALVDGELDGAERDRAHAHLASCEPCRAEAAELRALKQTLHTLISDAPAEAAMTRRLVALTGPGGPMPLRHGRLRAVSGRRRTLMLGTVTLVVGLSTVAFTVGGGSDAVPGPRITPPVEMYSVEHAITTGEVPFAPPAAQPSASAYRSTASLP
jgi:anti-sigma factor RsiW